MNTANRNATAATIGLRRGDSPTATIVSLGPVTLVFSYSTIVAYAVAGEGWVRSENVWSKTTGKHLNQEVPRGVEPTPHVEFTRMLDAMLARFGYAQDGR